MFELDSMSKLVFHSKKIKFGKEKNQYVILVVLKLDVSTQF